MPTEKRYRKSAKTNTTSAYQLQLSLDPNDGLLATVAGGSHAYPLAQPTAGEVLVSSDLDVSSTNLSAGSVDMRRMREANPSKQTALTALSGNVELFAQANEASGKVISLLPQYGYLPVLIGRDQQPIPVYAFVEALDDAADYDAIQAAFPALTFGQISGTLAFLRKLVQFNTRDLDIDELEDAQFEATDAFRRQLTQALADQEVVRVLTANQRHG